MRTHTCIPLIFISLLGGFFLGGFFLGGFLLGGWTTPVPAESLRDLVEEYQKAKKEFLQVQEARKTRQGRRGLNKKAQGGKKAERRANPRDLERILVRIAALEDEAALGFLRQEYAGPDPFIITACAGALLERGDDQALQIVIRGYNRDGRWTAGAQAAVLDRLVSSSREEGVGLALKLARGRKPELQAIALKSLALLPGDDRAFQGILQALDHRVLEVRRAALRALKDFRRKELIPLLIDRLSAEKDGSLQLDTLQFLVDLTGTNMGLEVEDWRKWWLIQGDRFQVGRVDGKEGRGQGKKRGRKKDSKKEGEKKTLGVARDLQYFGIEVASNRIAFLVDASLSMLRVPGEKKAATGQGKRGRRKGAGQSPPAGGKRRIDILKEELTRILKKLPGETQINIIYFDNRVISWKKQLHSLRGSGRGEAISFVNGLSCAYGTNIYDSLEMALKDRRVDSIYLLSDGQPVGGKYDRPDDIIREIGAINRIRGAEINCISFGSRSAFLEKLAAGNGGEYRIVDGT